MAATIQVEGPQEIQWHDGTDYQTLGYTEDGVTLRSRPFYRDVYGDRNGGQEGPPVEKLLLGEILEATFALSKFDPAIWETIASYRDGQGAAVAGNFSDAEIGSPVFENSFHSLLKLAGTTTEMRLPRCVVSGYEIGKGTKYSRLVISIEAHRSTATTDSVYITTPVA